MKQSLFCRICCPMWHYFSDFVAKTSESDHWLIESKGREDVEVQIKDRAAHQWCQNATELN